MIPENIQMELKIHPEKEDWYKERFPEYFFNTPEEALEYNRNRIQRQQEEKQTLNAFEGKFAEWLKKAVEEVLNESK